MKTNIRTFAVLSTALLSFTAYAQTDTVRVKETQVIHDTVVREPARTERPPLRRGEFGIRYMPTFSALRVRTYGGDYVDGQLSMSQGMGIMLGYNFDRHVGIVGEVNYNEIHQKYKDRSLERTVHVNYLNIPVMLSLNTNKTLPVNLNFVAGPQFGLNVGSTVKTNGTANNDSLKAVVAARPGDVGLAYGAGLEFALNREHTFRIDLGFRGYYGFVDMAADQSSKNPDTYNVLVKASRKTYAGYIGIAFLF